MARKAGATFVKDIRDWFNPLDTSHVLAYRQFKMTGDWPESFPLEEIWLGPNWEQIVEARIAEYPLEHKCLKDFEFVQSVVDNIHFPGYHFRVGLLGERIFVQVHYVEPDVMTGVTEDQFGREWVVAKNPVAGQVVQTCLKAILTSMEHRVREHFLYRDKPVMQPHFDVDELWQLLPSRTS